MKDAGQKNLIFRHFSSQRWFTIPEVPVYFEGGEQDSRKLITDIDVFALRPSTNLTWEVVLADCKTLKGQSPANRAIWLTGLMKIYGSRQGIVILQRNKNQAIESDHKLFASTLGISLLEETEFDRFDRAVIYPAGSSNYPYNASDLNSVLNASSFNTRLKALSVFLGSTAWQNADFVSLLRTTIGHVKSVAGELDPKKDEHVSIALMAVSAFAVGLASCTGLIFQRYLQPNSEKQLSDALKVIIWGGKERYDFLSSLRGELMKAKGINKSEDENLSLPQWEKFVQLVRASLEHPRICFDLPHLLQIAALDIRLDQTFLRVCEKQDLEVIKMGLFTTDYMLSASGLPREFQERVSNLLADRMSALVHSK